MAPRRLPGRQGHGQVAHSALAARLGGVGAQAQLVAEAAVVLVANIGVGQELLLGRTEQDQGRREQRAVEHLVEAGASVVVGELLGALSRRCHTPRGV